MKEERENSLISGCLVSGRTLGLFIGGRGDAEGLFKNPGKIPGIVIPAHGGNISHGKVQRFLLA